MIAALFVQEGGVYYGLPDVDPWPASRDARLYDGPWPVVAHPPCERWGRYWGGGPSARVPRKLGDDGGCFEAALSAVRVWGGVLEHPEASHAWRRFGIATPDRKGGWQRLWCGGWTCCVEQGAYGHRARKATWLYMYGGEPMRLRWGVTDGDYVRLDDGFHTKEERTRAAQTLKRERLTVAERAATPIEFRDVLLDIARSVKGAA